MMSRFQTKTHAVASNFTNQLSKWNRFAILCACIAIVALFTATAGAQDNASITGTVTDPSGAAVVNASITITNVATGQVRNTVSNSSGDFLFANVGAGQYTMTATAPGFQKFSRAGIVIHVAQTLEENVAFKVGNTQETVNVEADALQVQSRRMKSAASSPASRSRNWRRTDAMSPRSPLSGWESRTTSLPIPVRMPSPARTASASTERVLVTISTYSMGAS